MAEGPPRRIPEEVARRAPRYPGPASQGRRYRRKLRHSSRVQRYSRSPGELLQCGPYTQAGSRERSVRQQHLNRLPSCQLCILQQVSSRVGSISQEDRKRLVGINTNGCPISRAFCAREVGLLTFVRELNTARRGCATSRERGGIPTSLNQLNTN